MLIIARQLITQRLSGSSVLVRQAARACGASAASRSLATHHNNIGTHTQPASAAANDVNGNKLHAAAAAATTSSIFTRMHHCAADLKDSYEYILVERRFPEDSDVVGGGVGVISLHRP